VARNLANAVAAARPVRASSGVHAANGGTTAQSIGVSRAKTASGIGLGAARVVKPAASAPAPATASAPAPGISMPWDARAQQEVGEAQTTEGNALGELGADWTGREAYYGFGANGANNPYSQATLLATHHEWNERGRSNASGLQAFAGSNVNAERENVNNYTTSYGQLLQAYEAEKVSKEAREEAAKRELAAAEQAAQLAAIERAAETAPEPVAAPSSPGGGNQEQAGGVTKKNKQGKKIGVGGARKA
jgi:hypothetical protein